MQTLYKYNPNINKVQRFNLISQDEKFITIEDEHGTKWTELLWDLESYSKSQVDAVEKYLAWYSERMEEIRKQSREITRRHVAAVDLYEELTEQ